MLTGLLKNASFGPPPNLHKRISHVEVNRFGQCLGWRFSHISTFFSLVSSRAFRDALHSRFRCGDPNQCLPNFLKMQLLALPQIYTRVFHLWKSIDLNRAQSAHNQALKNFSSVHFTGNKSLLELVQSPWDSEISPKFLEIDPKFVRITLCVARSRRLSALSKSIDFHK